MKIIEKKEWEKAWSWRFTCPTCESVLEAETKDLRYTPASGGNSRDYCNESYHVNCCICAQKVTVVGNDVPKYVKKLAQRPL